MNVVIIGASANPDRYSNRAQKKLTEAGYETIPVSLSGADILGRKGYRSVTDIPENMHPVHTVTVYLNPTRFADIADDVIALSPERVILNPGTESEEISERMQNAGIHVVEACTLVLLSLGQFDTA